MSDNPNNPFPTILDAAIAVHEIYTSYVDAGFNETQALQLVAVHIGTVTGGTARE